MTPCFLINTMQLNSLINYIAMIGKCCIRRTKYIQLTVLYTMYHLARALQAVMCAETELQAVQRLE